MNSSKKTKRLPQSKETYASKMRRLLEKRAKKKRGGAKKKKK